MIRIVPSQFPLAALCGLLIGILGWEIAAPIVLPQTGPSRAMPLPAMPVFPAAQPPAENFDDIENRLVFNPSRGPMAASGQVTVAGDMTAGGFSLIGVVLDGARRIALIRSGGETSRVGEGDAIGSWKITSIDADHVVLRSAGTSKEIFLAGKPLR